MVAEGIEAETELTAGIAADVTAGPGVFEGDTIGASAGLVSLGDPTDGGFDG